MLLFAIAPAAGQPPVRAALQAPRDRSPAPELVRKDSAGKALNLRKYRGKALLLNFWATWCHGCKEEIPWFREFGRAFGAKKFAVVGVSLDEGGWSVVGPFLSSAKVPYRIVLGDEPAAKSYGIETMPDTFLLDRQGRIAVVYRGLVDREDIEANIRRLIAER